MEYVRLAGRISCRATPECFDQACRISLLHHIRSRRRSKVRFAGRRRLCTSRYNSNVPLVTPTTLSWQQIIEFRSDNKARSAYRRFHLWLSDFHPRSEREATDIVGKRLEDYLWAVKKHGLQTTKDTAKLVASVPARYGHFVAGAALGTAVGIALFGV